MRCKENHLNVEIKVSLHKLSKSSGDQNRGRPVHCEELLPDASTSLILSFQVAIPLTRVVVGDLQTMAIGMEIHECDSIAKSWS